MVDLKKQDFWPKINILKGYFALIQWITVCQNNTFKFNRWGFFSFKNINLVEHTLVKTFLLNSIFKLFLKSFLIFDTAIHKIQ